MKFKKLFYKKIELMKKAVIFMVLIMLMVFPSCEKTGAEQATNTEQEEAFFNLQGEHGFVGTLDGTNAFVSILLGAEAGIAYVCNGEKNSSEWFSGPVSDMKKIRFTNSTRAIISASFIDNSFKGEMIFKEGTPFSFTTTVNNGISGGIYRVIDEKAEKAEISMGITWRVFQQHSLT